MKDFRNRLKMIDSLSEYNKCFINDGDCNGNPIKSHSIQNNRILNRLSDNGEVYTLSQIADKHHFNLTMQRTGRKKATTWPGYCSFHDSKIFKPIEDHDYRNNDARQNFLFAMRAFSKEYFLKKSQSESYHKAINIIENNDPEEINKFFSTFNSVPTKQKLFQIKKFFTEYLLGLNKTLEHLGAIRDYFLDAYSKKNYSDLKTYVISFENCIGIAASSITFMENDIDGNIINNIGDIDAELSPIIINIFPQQNSTFILLTSFNFSKTSYNFLELQLLNQTEFTQKIIISQLLMNYCENVVISPELWENFTDRVKKSILYQWEKTIYSSDIHFDLYSEINLFR